MALPERELSSWMTRLWPPAANTHTHFAGERVELMEAGRWHLVFISAHYTTANLETQIVLSLSTRLTQQLALLSGPQRTTLVGFSHVKSPNRIYLITGWEMEAIKRATISQLSTLMGWHSWFNTNTVLSQRGIWFVLLNCTNKSSCRDSRMMFIVMISQPLPHLVWVTETSALRLCALVWKIPLSLSPSPSSVVSGNVT